MAGSVAFFWRFGWEVVDRVTRSVRGRAIAAVALFQVGDPRVLC